MMGLVSRSVCVRVCGLNILCRTGPDSDGDGDAGGRPGCPRPQRSGPLSFKIDSEGHATVTLADSDVPGIA